MPERSWGWPHVRIGRRLLLRIEKQRNAWRVSKLFACSSMEIRGSIYWLIAQSAFGRRYTRSICDIYLLDAKFSTYSYVHTTDRKVMCKKSNRMWKILRADSENGSYSTFGFSNVRSSSSRSPSIASLRAFSSGVRRRPWRVSCSISRYFSKRLFNTVNILALSPAI